MFINQGDPIVQSTRHISVDHRNIIKPLYLNTCNKVSQKYDEKKRQQLWD